MAHLQHTPDGIKIRRKRRKSLVRHGNSKAWPIVVNALYVGMGHGKIETRT